MKQAWEYTPMEEAILYVKYKLAWYRLKLGYKIRNAVKRKEKA